MTIQESLYKGIGSVNVSSIPLPADVKVLSGTYTYSGKVLITYKTESDIDTVDYFNIAVADDDGTNFKRIFSGVIPTKPKANGIRYMPFQDNRRVLLGDYVLECSPDIDNCESAALVSIEYPSCFEEDERVSHHWSEIIIAPDNKHMSWTMLRSDIGAAVAIGSLERQEDQYVIENVQLISTVHYFEQDQGNEGYILPNLIRGGEVKQFVRGGSAISAVGAKRGSTPDSVVQDLASEELTQITFTPGYDETTIFSPDERLGIVMSSRFSTRTDPAIFGLLPRPYGAITSMGIAWPLYMYAIAGVRKFREGNIGPALIDIERSMNESGYQGIQLTTDENWVYCSPMSWHPNGKRAMWPETYRGAGESRMRLQKVELLDYEPQPAVPFVTTPDQISYGIKDFSVFDDVNRNVEGKIAGKKSGVIYYKRDVATGLTESQYENFSDDGEHVYNGFEKVEFSFQGESRYEAKLQLTGPVPGEMNFRATFSALTGPAPAKLLFEEDADGQPKSYGFATYNGTTYNIEELSE